MHIFLLFVDVADYLLFFLQQKLVVIMCPTQFIEIVQRGLADILENGVEVLYRVALFMLIVLLHVLHIDSLRVVHGLLVLAFVELIQDFVQINNSFIAVESFAVLLEVRDCLKVVH